jgi:hypothetical protein
MRIFVTPSTSDGEIPTLNLSQLRTALTGKEEEEVMVNVQKGNKIARELIR